MTGDILRKAEGAMEYLSLGCGTHFVLSWTNIDFVAAHPSVRAWDLTRGIPSASESFDVVYHSHVLEHFDRPGAARLMTECFRVLRPGGTLRVVAPDLEWLTRGYLAALECGIRKPDPVAQANHEWTVVHLLDQMVRDEPGGDMVRYMKRKDIRNAEFVLSRMGAVGRRCMNGDTPPALERGAQLRRLLRAAAHPLQVLRRSRELGLRVLLGANDYSKLQLGRFRRSGEVHRWMYDRYSLSVLLRDAGFVDARPCAAQESRIAGWRTFHLDTDPDGTAYHPESLYMEAVRP